MGRVVDESYGSAILANEIAYAELRSREEQAQIADSQVYDTIGQLRIENGKMQFTSGQTYDEDDDGNRTKAVEEIADALIASSRPKIYGETLNPEYLPFHLLLCAMIMQALDDYIEKCENLKRRQSQEQRYKDLIEKANIEWFIYNSSFCKFILHSPTKLLKGVREEFTCPFLMETYFHRENLTFAEWFQRGSGTDKKESDDGATGDSGNSSEADKGSMAGGGPASDVGPAAGQESTVGGGSAADNGSVDGQESTADKEHTAGGEFVDDILQFIISGSQTIAAADEHKNESREEALLRDFISRGWSRTEPFTWRKVVKGRNYFVKVSVERH